jgi:tungstate transport system permease protein
VNTYPQDVSRGLHQALALLVHGNSFVVHATLLTLWLAVTSTAVGALIGVPCGCLLGIGTSRTSRILLGFATAVTRIPPVAVGIMILILFNESSLWGGGPFAGVHVVDLVYLAQTALAAPIVVVLTAAAVQGVPRGLLDQADAYGASRPQRAVLAVREARRAVFAGVIVAMGVTITAIGAIAIVEPSFHTLAMSAFQSLTQVQPGEQPTFDVHTAIAPATYAMAIALATVLMGLFVVVAGALTWLQEKRSVAFAGMRI